MTLIPTTRRSRRWWACLVVAAAAGQPAVAAPPTPIDFPDSYGVACLDSKAQIQKIEDASFYQATLGSLRAAWAKFGHDFRSFQVDDKTGLLRFRDTDPPPDEYSYEVKLRQGDLVVVGLTIEQNHKVQHLVGTEACIQLFDLFHR